MRWHGREIRFIHRVWFWLQGTLLLSTPCVRAFQESNRRGKGTTFLSLSLLAVSTKGRTTVPGYSYCKILQMSHRVPRGNRYDSVRNLVIGGCTEGEQLIHSCKFHEGRLILCTQPSFFLSSRFRSRSRSMEEDTWSRNSCSVRFHNFFSRELEMSEVARTSGMQICNKFHIPLYSNRLKKHVLERPKFFWQNKK